MFVTVSCQILILSDSFLLSIKATFSAKSHGVLRFQTGNTIPPVFFPVVLLTSGVTYTLVVPASTVFPPNGVRREPSLSQ